jgi:hypothetical protein
MNEAIAVNYNDLTEEQAMMLISDRKPVFKSGRSHLSMPRFSILRVKTSSPSVSSFHGGSGY